jgi:glucose/mannose transport system substrate-binding protein
MAGREWDGVMPMFVEGKAGFIFQGDWAIGTFNGAGLKEGTDYLCAPAPHQTDQPGFILNSDSVIFFKQQNPDVVAGQELLAHLIMSPEFQTIFNQAKGSIPARLDVSLEQGFNPCQQAAQKDLQASVAAGDLVLSMAHNMAVAQKYRGAMFEVITEFVNDPSVASAEAAAQLAEAVESQM